MAFAHFPRKTQRFQRLLAETTEENLEDDALWPVFHHQLIMCLYQIMLPGPVDRYRARVSQRHYVTERDRSGSVTGEEHHEDFIEIRQRADGQLIALVDVVSPANKVTPAGRAFSPMESGENPLRRPLHSRVSRRRVPPD